MVKKQELRVWQQQTDEREQRLAVLDAAIARGLDVAQSGRVHSIEEVRARLRTRFGTVPPLPGPLRATDGDGPGNLEEIGKD
jgi:hypothetical protein